jgi:hypothetical protein
MYGNASGNPEFTIDTICPELTNPETMDHLKNPAGVIVTIDTT